MRPLLYFVQTRGYQGIKPSSRVMPVENLGEAIRTADRQLEGYTAGRSQAGQSWWLVAGWTESEARRQVGFLIQGIHTRQLDIEQLHAAIREGLDPDLTLLREDDVFWGRPRESPEPSLLLPFRFTTIPLKELQNAQLA